jgi:UDP-GlcNAc:undecaprenyl-phosphate GlcNAc-1-phosphate transferase
MDAQLQLFFAALISCAINLGLTPFILWISHKKGWFDSSNHRKIHSGNIPRLGGVGMFLSFALSIAFVGSLFSGASHEPWASAYWPLAVSLVAMHGLGLADDFLDLRALLKFAIQLGAAILVASSGFVFRAIPVPFSAQLIELGWVSYPLTVLWIVGVTNALNLIDGMDGLAGGVSLVAGLTMGILLSGGSGGAGFGAMAAFCMMGAIAGFLFYNFPPARLFMGDSGSLLLGFTLAVLPLIDAPSGARPSIDIWQAATILFVPILDTFGAMIRRRMKGISFFTPDKHHIHHNLLRLGLTERPILGIIYGACMILGATAIAGAHIESNGLSILIMGVACIACVAAYVSVARKARSAPELSDVER